MNGEYVYSFFWIRTWIHEYTHRIKNSTMLKWVVSTNRIKLKKKKYLLYDVVCTIVSMQALLISAQLWPHTARAENLRFTLYREYV